MPSLLYWGLGTSVYLHSSSSTPADLWSQPQYYISVTRMPVKISYTHCLVDPDLPSSLAAQILSDAHAQKLTRGPAKVTSPWQKQSLSKSLNSR